MTWLKNIGMVLGILIAMVVLGMLGVICWFLYKAMGFIITGIVVIVLVWFIFFGDTSKKPLP